MNISHSFETIPSFVGMDFVGFTTCLTEYIRTVEVLQCGATSTSIRISTLNLEGENLN